MYWVINGFLFVLNVYKKNIYKCDLKLKIEKIILILLKNVYIFVN